MKEAQLFIEELYEAYYTVLEKMCRRKTNYDPAFSDLVDETLQEVFILAFEYYDTLKDHPNIQGWLMQTCNHRLLPYAKQQRYRQSRHAFSLDDDHSPSLAAEDDFAETTAQKESNLQMIDTIFALLTPKEKQVFEDYFINHQPIAAIAKKQKTTKSGIKALIYRIRQKAKKNNHTFLLFSVTFLLCFYYSL